MTHDEQRLAKAERIFNRWNATMMRMAWNGNYKAVARVAKRLESLCRGMAPIQERTTTKFYIG